LWYFEKKLDCVRVEFNGVKQPKESGYGFQQQSF